MNSGGLAPALSRDGKLLAYVSTLRGGISHIWVQQTAGGEGIPVTRGHDGEYWPDFSPDGTHIAFVTAVNGVYIGPTLPGEPKLIIGELNGIDRRKPRFSPTGDKILYWEDQSKAMIVPVDGGTPISLDLNRNFRVDSPPRWSPSGNETTFYGSRKSEPVNPGHWWIAGVNGGDAQQVQLPGVVEGDSVDPFGLGWIRYADGREWIVYPVSSRDDWKLLRAGISARGEIDQKFEQLAAGTGGLGGTALSEDGKLAYSIGSSSRAIYEIPVNDHGQKAAPTQQLSFSEQGDEQSPSLSRDGRWMVYNATRPGKPNSILLRDLSTDTDRVLDDRDRTAGNGGEASISPDGSKVIFSRECKEGRFGPLEGPLPCGFLVSAEGGKPEPVCEFCNPRGFSSNGSVLLVEKYDRRSTPHDTIVAIDLVAKKEENFLSLPDENLYHAFFSWDDRWVVFKEVPESGKARIMIAPVRNGIAGRKAEWVAITDGRYSDDKPQFSPDGNTIYFTSIRDSYLCIWTQKLDPTTKRLVGAATAFEHFHNSMGSGGSTQNSQRQFDLTVARDKVMINLPDQRFDIWMVQLE
jgi:Tol biopolymer transport system component